MKTFFNKGDSYFWMTDMLVVRDLKKDTIKMAITDSILDHSFINIFCKIGDIEQIFREVPYEKLIDMNDFSIDNS